MKLLTSIVFLLCTTLIQRGTAQEVAEFLSNFNATAEEKYYDSVVAEWEYNTDITDETQAEANAKSSALANWESEQAKIAQTLDTTGASDEEKRLIGKIKEEGIGALNSEDLDLYTKTNSKMQTTYSTAKICDVPGHQGCMPLDPDLTEIMASSRDYDLLEEVWTKWRDAAGKPIREDFKTYVDLQNKAARANGYADAKEWWLSAYETADIEQQFEVLWDGILPLYEQLHAYIRRKLYNKYRPGAINLNGPIPAHLLGNMWAQDWSDIYDLVEPYQGKVRPDATVGILEKGWTAQDMFHESDAFFTGLGLIPMPQEFWDDTMYTKPVGKEVVCHASAWDFYNRKDFRIKMCTTLTQRDFVTIHHEMGHIQYFLQYAQQPVTFREGANPGFHEAVGDTLALSVGTLDHLYKLGLIDEPSDDLESDINYLMSIALDKIAFIPFGYLMDKWRWDVFSGRVNEKNWNEAWWDYRRKYQGLTPPNQRTELDFDPASKFHISNNVPYIRYFVSYIVQFQFYEQMCKESGYDVINQPLYKCDFNGSMAAGQKFSDMLSLGSSKIWEDAMEQLTGARIMSSKSLFNYFEPLYEFLKAENEKNGEVIGWPEYSWEPDMDDYSASSTLSASILMSSVAIFLNYFM